jgi:hypothetical protein
VVKTIVMGRVAVILLVLTFLLCGCGLFSSGEEEDQFEGYLLRSEDDGPSVGVLYVRYKPGKQPDTLTGYIHFAYPAENPEGAFLSTERITGSVDGPRIFIQLETNPQAEYIGTVEGDKMELRNGLVEWTGEAATYQAFGEAAEEMERAAEEGSYQGG